MKACIILFSPSGHTLQVGEMIKESLENKGVDVSLTNIKKQNALLNKDFVSKHSTSLLGTYDLLFLGAPVYAGHAEKHMLDLIDGLPLPSEKEGRSDLVVPFVTYGGAHSILGLEEMGKKLKKKKYKSILGLKVACYHTLSGNFTKPILPDRPDESDRQLIHTCVERAIKISKNKEEAMDCSKSFCYSPLLFRVVLHFLTQEKMHQKHKTLSVNPRCTTCKKCIQACPVNNIVLEDGKIKIGEHCILCGECFNACPYQAINFDYSYHAQKLLKDGNIQLESPLSCIYPLSDY